MDEVGLPGALARKDFPLGKMSWAKTYL